MKRPALIRILAIGRVPIFAHWSLLIAFFLALAATQNIVKASISFCSFFFLMLIHELGHAAAARKMGVPVISIELYPVHGLCYFEMPDSARADIFIAWGGVAAQGVLLALAVLLGTILSALGVKTPELLYPLFFVLVPLNAVLIVTNLMPIALLDGAKAWGVLRLLAPRIRSRPQYSRKKKKATTSSNVVKLKERKR